MWQTARRPEVHILHVQGGASRSFCQSRRSCSWDFDSVQGKESQTCRQTQYRIQVVLTISRMICEKLLVNFFNIKVGFPAMPGLSQNVWVAGVILDGSSLQQILNWGQRNFMGFLARVLMPKLKFLKLMTMKKIPMMKQTRQDSSCRDDAPQSCLSLLSNYYHIYKFWT